MVWGGFCFSRTSLDFCLDPHPDPHYESNKKCRRVLNGILRHFVCLLVRDYLPHGLSGLILLLAGGVGEGARGESGVKKVSPVRLKNVPPRTFLERSVLASLDRFAADVPCSWLCQLPHTLTPHGSESTYSISKRESVQKDTLPFMAETVGFEPTSP